MPRNPRKKIKESLEQEYLLLLQFIADCYKSQLILKSIVVTLLAGGAAIILAGSSEYIAAINLSQTSKVLLDMQSLAISFLLCVMISYFAFMHREFEHIKRINYRIVARIEYEHNKLGYTDGIKYKIQLRGDEISYQLNQEKEFRFLSKADFLGYLFYKLAFGLCILVLVIDTLLISIFHHGLFREQYCWKFLPRCPPILLLNLLQH